MIKTHRPRGHAWNCATVFQQSLQFRHIDFDRCQATPDVILFDEPESDLQHDERAAKRRRIESLAQDFLDGLQLVIHSARPNPPSLATSLAPSFPRPKDARRILEELELSTPSTSIWEDVDSDREVLRSFASRSRSNRDHQRDLVADIGARFDNARIVVQVEAQASCRSARRLRSGRVTATVGPSEDALRRAAELRNRRLRAPVMNGPYDPLPTSCPRPTILETQDQATESSLYETASDCGPTPTPAWTSSKWIKTGEFQLRKKGVDEDCSKDELGASSIFTPSQRTRSHARPLARGGSTRNHPSLDSSHTPPRSGLALDAAASMRHSVSEVGHDGLNSGPSSVVVAETSDPSQATHRSSPNPGLAQASCMAKVATESSVPIGKEGDGIENSTYESTEARSTHLRSPPHPSQGSARMLFKGRKAKSTGNSGPVQPQTSPQRRQSAPTESQVMLALKANSPNKPETRNLRGRTVYTALAVNGSSPFVYRKRKTRLENSEQDIVEHISIASIHSGKTVRRRMTLPSSDSPVGTEQGPLSAQQSDTPLIDQHLNRILPKDPTSGRRSSVTKRALRNELRASGAELTRCADDSGSSQDMSERSQPQEPVANLSDNLEIVSAPELVQVPNVDSQPPWQGTQKLMAQAWNELCDSPDITRSSTYLDDKSMPGTDKRTVPTRNPLKQLSQEPMPLPSTQALMDAYPEWSTIKKPQASSKRMSIGPSPIMEKGRARIVSDPVQSLTADRRRSSLRFSTSYSASPGTTQSKEAQSQDRADLRPPHFHPDVSGFLKPMPRRSVGQTASSLSFGVSTLDLPTTSESRDQNRAHSFNGMDELSFERTTSDFQCAQRQESLDSQELSTMVTMVTQDVLTTGVEDVMSRSRLGKF